MTLRFEDHGEDIMQQWVVVRADDCMVVGPFESHDAADAYVIDARLDADACFIAPLEQPSEED